MYWEMRADAKASSYSGAKAGDLIRRYAFDRRYCSIERQGAVFILAWGNGPGSWGQSDASAERAIHFG